MKQIASLNYKFKIEIPFSFTLQNQYLGNTSVCTTLIAGEIIVSYLYGEKQKQIDYQKIFNLLSIKHSDKKFDLEYENFKFKITKKPICRPDNNLLFDLFLGIIYGINCVLKLYKSKNEILLNINLDFKTLLNENNSKSINVFLGGIIHFSEKHFKDYIHLPCLSFINLVLEEKLNVSNVITDPKIDGYLLSLFISGLYRNDLTLLTQSLNYKSEKKKSLEHNTYISEIEYSNYNIYLFANNIDAENFNSSLQNHKKKEGTYLTKINTLGITKV